MIDTNGGVSDSDLLKSLAEDVPDMAYSVREQLRDIASDLKDRDDLKERIKHSVGEVFDLLITIIELEDRLKQVVGERDETKAKLEKALEDKAELVNVLCSFDGSFAVDQWDETFAPSRKWNDLRRSVIAKEAITKCKKVEES